MTKKRKPLHATDFARFKGATQVSIVTSVNHHLRVQLEEEYEVGMRLFVDDLIDRRVRTGVSLEDAIRDEINSTADADQRIRFFWR